MRVLFISSELIGSALCQRLVAEGHNVKLFINDPSRKRCLDEIVPKTEDWKKELAWVGKRGLIVFDDVGFGKEQNMLRKKGYRVVGGSLGGDKLEIDRKFFHTVLKQYKIPFLPTHHFKTTERAVAFIRKNPARWVLKQTSHESSLNYIGINHDGSDVIDMLHVYKDANISPMYLQRFVEGIEVGVARYFNGNDWVGPVEINHEFKHLLEGDSGPLTPEMGTVMWLSDDEDLPLFEATLKKLTPHLRKIDFRGDIDINCIISGKHIYPLEATSRFGTPATELQCELYTSLWGSFLAAIADGKPFDLQYKRDFGIVVTLTVPPFPHAPTPSQQLSVRLEDTKISFNRRLNVSDRSHYHFEEVALKNERGHTLYWAGKHGQVLHVTASKRTIPQAKKSVYALLDNIKLHGMYYRKDIGDRVHKHELAKLRAWGWV